MYKIIESTHDKYIDGSFLDEILKIDSECYADPDYIPGRESIRARFFACRESYLLLMDGETLAGYMSYFPITVELEREINKCKTIYDDNILPESIARYSKGCPVLIYSICVRKAYRGTGAADRLANELMNKLTAKTVGTIYAYAVSGGGESMMRRLDFTQICEVGKSKLYVKRLKQ